MFTFFIGCSDPSSPTNISVHTPIVKTPFTFHKPRLGASFAMRASQNGKFDTIFHYTVTDTSATHDGKSDVVEFGGYYRPFYISYDSSGDIYVWGNSDYIFGRDSWVSYPLAVKSGTPVETYSHDSIISNPDPNDTKTMTRDTATVVGSDTLIVNNQPLACIHIVLRETYTLRGLKTPSFSSSNTLKVEYWYAPSIGYWAKVHVSYTFQDVVFELVDYTL